MDKVSITLDALEGILSDKNNDIGDWEEVLNTLPHVTAYSEEDQYSDVMAVSQILAVVFPVAPEEVRDSDGNTEPEEVYSGLMKFYADETTEFKAAVSCSKFNTEYLHPGLRCSWRKATRLILKHMHYNILASSGCTRS